MGGAFHRQRWDLDGLSLTSRVVSQGSVGMGPTRGLEPEQELVFNWKQLRGGPASDLGAAYSGKRRKEKTHLEEGDQDAEKEGMKAVMMDLWKKGDTRSCEQCLGAQRCHHWEEQTPALNAPEPQAGLGQEVEDTDGHTDLGSTERKDQQSVFKAEWVRSGSLPPSGLCDRRSTALGTSAGRQQTGTLASKGGCRKEPEAGGRVAAGEWVQIQAPRLSEDGDEQGLTVEAQGSLGTAECQSEVSDLPTRQNLGHCSGNPGGGD